MAVPGETMTVGTEGTGVQADTDTGASEHAGAPRDGDSEENKAKVSDPTAAAQNPEPVQAAGSEQESNTASETGSDSTAAVNESSDMGSHDKGDQQEDQSQQEPTQQGQEQE